MLISPNHSNALLKSLECGRKIINFRVNRAAKSEIDLTQSQWSFIQLPSLRVGALREVREDKVTTKKRRRFRKYMAKCWEKPTRFRSKLVSRVEHRQWVQILREKQLLLAFTSETFIRRCKCAMSFFKSHHLRHKRKPIRRLATALSGALGGELQLWWKFTSELRI